MIGLCIDLGIVWKQPILTIWQLDDPKEPKKPPIYTRKGSEIPQLQDSPNPNDWPPSTSVERQAEAAKMWLYETTAIEKDGLLERI
jgi:hypothetical protein